MVWENERSIIIGRGQYAHYETDLDRCTSKMIPVVRRFTGGGAVYNGPGNVNWSFFATPSSGPGRIGFEWNVRGIFRMSSSVIVEALSRLGVRAWLEEPNKICTIEGKVSGMAAFLTKERLLCHGTLLLNADLSEAQLLTTPSGEGVAKRYVRSAHTPIANLGIDRGSFVVNLREVLSRDLGGFSVASGPEKNEIDMAEQLRAKYMSQSWNLGDPFSADFGNQERVTHRPGVASDSETRQITYR